MICSAVKEDDKVVGGPRVLIQVDQHLHHHLDHDIGDEYDANASVDGDGGNFDADGDMMLAKSTSAPSRMAELDFTSGIGSWGLRM